MAHPVTRAAGPPQGRKWLIRKAECATGEDDTTMAMPFAQSFGKSLGQPFGGIRFGRSALSPSAAGRSVSLAASGPADRLRSALWARRLALWGAQVLLLAVLLHRFGPLPTPTLLATIKVAMGIGALAVVFALFAVQSIWRKGGYGVGPALLGSVAGLGLLGWPLAALPALLKTPALPDISTDPNAPPQFQELARGRQAGANPVAYQSEKFARLQAETYPDIKTMVVTRPGLESFELTREIIRRMKWVEVAARPPANANAVGEIEAQATTPIVGFRDDVVIRLKGERDKTRIDIRSAAPYGQHDLGRNAERVRGLMKELHIRLDLGVPLEPEPVARRRSIRKKLLEQARGQVTAGQPGTPAAQPQSSAPRERVRTPEPRSRDENPARGKRRRQSWE